MGLAEAPSLDWNLVYTAPMDLDIPSPRFESFGTQLQYEIISPIQYRARA